MQESFSDLIKSLPSDAWLSETVGMRRIENDDDLWYAVAECKITPEQEEYVNPTGFSIGRAYINPDDNVPCVIFKSDGERIGYIVLRTWLGSGKAFNWSYFIDRRFQGMGYGTAAAKLAIKILRAVDPEIPIKLSAEASNTKAHRLYHSIGFTKSDELDGDDWVFILY